MKTSLFYDKNVMSDLEITPEQVYGLVDLIAEGLETDDLVVALFMVDYNFRSPRGEYFRSWMKPSSFFMRFGRFNATQRFARPDDLPEKYRLIRIKASKENFFPFIIYFREYRIYFHTFYDYLAWLFAHELYHYLEHKKNEPHDREAEEDAACLWAYARVKELGFNVRKLTLDEILENTVIIKLGDDDFTFPEI